MLAVIIIFAFLSTFIQRITGFGFGIVFMTVAPFLMPSYAEAISLSGMLAIVCALGTGLQLLGKVPWRKMLVILATFLVISFFAVRIVAMIDGMQLKRILGVILIFVSMYFFFLNGKIRMKPNAATQMGMGTISGLMGGLFGMQGPPAVIYFISCTSDKDEYMAVTQWYFIIGNIFMSLCRAGSGFITREVWITWLCAVPAVLVALFLGSRVYSKMPVTLIRKFVYVFIGVAGLLAIISGR